VGNEEKQERPAAPLSARGAARRRFAKVGVGSGVIATLASHPAMAGSVRCTTPSGFTSAHWDSHSPGSTFLGRSPGYWKNHQDAWKPYLKLTALFGSIFEASPALGNCTMYDVCAHINDAKDLDKGNVASHIVATLLNVRAGLVKVLTEQRVIEMWNEYSNTGSFTPSAGANPWYASDITTYLKSTMDCGLDADACTTLDHV
jgi:hypothetical protein